MRILLVEDEPAIARLIQDCYCAPGGHECVIAHTRAAAELTVGEFDIVIADLNLPDSDGWETLIPIRAKFPAKTPIMVMSAVLPEGGIPKAIELGAADVLLKPWLSATRFAEAIEVAMARSRHPLIDRMKEVVNEAKATLDSIQVVGESINTAAIKADKPKSDEAKSKAKS